MSSQHDVANVPNLINPYPHEKLFRLYVQKLIGSKFEDLLRYVTISGRKLKETAVIVLKSKSNVKRWITQ